MDQLRGVAVISVLFVHICGLYFKWQLPWVNGVRDFSSSGHHFGLLKPILVQLVYLSSGVVPFFWVLSGFCIHWSCLSWERFDTPRFIWTRFFRIYPVYIVTLLFFSLTGMQEASLPHLASRQFLAQFFTHLFCIHNFWDGTILTLNTPAWTLAVEVQLYLLYPLLLALKQHLGWAKTLLIVGAVSFSWQMGAVRLYGLPVHYMTGAPMSSPFGTWLSWTLGAYLADKYALGQRGFRLNRNYLPAVAAFLAYAVSTVFQSLLIFSFFLASLAFVLALDVALNRAPQAQLRSEKVGPVARALSYFGLISYSLYLWHHPIMIECHRLVEKASVFVKIPVILFSLLLPIIIAHFSFRFLEKPGIKLGKKFLAALRSENRETSTATN